jgi:hypothetical protein
MDSFHPKLEVSVDENTGTVRAAYLRIRDRSVHETREIVEGRTFADYSAEGLLLGIELLAPCEARILDSISEEEPEPVRRFIRGSPPRELVADAPSNSPSVE